MSGIQDDAVFSGCRGVPEGLGIENKNIRLLEAGALASDMPHPFPAEKTVSAVPEQSL